MTLALQTPLPTLDEATPASHGQPRTRQRPHVRFTPVVDPEEVTPERIAGVMAGRFEFNGETHTLPEPLDWLANPSADVEWHILLHKGYYLVGLAQAWQRTGDAAYAQRWAELVDGWMRCTPPGFIAADVTGRRVQNWLASLHLLVWQGRPGTAPPLDAALLRRVLASLSEQVDYLCNHLTPKRNHRTLELLAIFMAGVLLPDDDRAEHWRTLALAETTANVQADLLADGVHCELSTDYHHLALRNWLQVRTLAADNGVAVPAALDAGLQRALDFALQIHQPSGRMPSLSDGDARCYLPLLAQGAALYGRTDMLFVASGGTAGTPPAERVAHFMASGYHVLRSGWNAAPHFALAQHLVFDCGPLGEGNHGHFDALSVELAAFGQALLVDPGRGTYSEAPSPEDGRNWRVHFRHTAAHNTVCVDGLPQTAYAPRPEKAGSRHAHGSVRHRIAGPAPDTRLVEQATTVGAQPGLDLLHGRCVSQAYDAVHERCIVFIDRRWWIVSDWLRAPGEHAYALTWQLAPAAQGRVVCLPLDDTDTGHCLQSPGLLLAQPQRAGQTCGLEQGWVAERYGQRQAAPVLRSRATGRNVDFDTVLVPMPMPMPMLAPMPLATPTTAVGQGGVEALAPPPAVRLIPVHGDAGQTGSALHIQCGAGQGQADDLAVHGWFHARGAQAQHWCIADTGLRFSGRWLHWRQDAAGRLLQATSHAGARLDSAQGPYPLQLAGGHRSPAWT